MATDFRMQGQAPMAAIISAYQNKAAQEQQMKLQEEQIKASKQARIQEVFKQGANLVSGLVEHSQNKRQQEARNLLAERLASQNELVPGPEMQPASSSMVPELTQAPTAIPRKDTPGFLPEMQGLAIKAGMKGADEAATKSLFEKPAEDDPLARIQKQLQVKKLMKGFQTEGAAVDAAKKVLINGGMPPEELEGLALDDLANLSNNTYKMKIANARESMAATMQERLEDSVSKTNMNTAIKVGNRINPGASNDVTIRRERVSLGNAAQLSVLAQAFKGQATKQEIREASTALAGLVMGGSSSGRIAKEQIDELTPSSLRGNIEGQIQWLTNKPRDAKMERFLNRMVKTAIREAREAEQNIRKAQVGILKGAESLKARSPEAYNAVLEAGGIDPKKVKDGEYVIDGDYSSVLPLFNPFNMTAEGIISGQQPLTIDLNEARKLSGLAYGESQQPEAPPVDAKSITKMSFGEAKEKIETMSLEALEALERELLGDEDAGF